MLLDGDEGHQPIGLGLEHLLEHRVSEDFLRASGNARSRNVSKSGIGPSSAPRWAKNRAISHATVSRSSSSRPPGNSR